MPTGNGAFKANSKLRFVQGSPTNGAILQAVRAPGNDAAVLYVLLAQDDAALDKFSKLLTDPKKSQLLTKEVAIMTADGELITLGTVSESETAASNQKESDRYTAAMTIGMGIFLLVLVLLIVWVARQFVRKPSTTRAA